MCSLKYKCLQYNTEAVGKVISSILPHVTRSYITHVYEELVFIKQLCYIIISYFQKFFVSWATHGTDGLLCCQMCVTNDSETHVGLSFVFCFSSSGTFGEALFVAEESILVIH